MALTDRLLTASRRSDCIMAAFPYQGGAWTSPIGGESGVTPIAGASTTGSWAVRNGLLKYNNMDASSGMFAIIDTAKPRWVETQLDLRGQLINHTFIIQANFDSPKVEAASGYFNLPLLSQGLTNGSSGVTSYYACATYHGASSIYIRGYGFDENGTTFGVMSPYVDLDLLGQTVTYAFSHQYNDGIIISKAYINGTLLNTYQHESTNGRYGSPGNNDYGGGRVRLGGSVVAENWLHKGFDQYTCGMIFNRALSDEEIKFLS